MNFFDMSVMAAVMIVVIIVIRKLLINRIPHQIWGMLWLLVIVRLYVPYKIETKFNFYSGLYYIRRAVAENDLLKMGYQEYYFDRVAHMIASIPGVKWILLFIWAMGMVIMLRYFCKDFTVSRKLWKKSKETLACEQAQQFLWDAGLNKSVEIRQSSEIDMPLAYGIFRPGILLPTGFGEYPSSAMRHMLLHEYLHLKYRHPLLQVVVIGVLCINWFNPIIWVWYHYMSRDMEIACDRHVLDLLGQNERESYALNLIHMAKSQSLEGAFYSGFAKNVMKERIVAIMKYKKTTMAALVISMLIPTGVASAFGTNDNYVFYDEVSVGEMTASAEELSSASDTEAIFVSYEDVEPYVVAQKERAVSSIVLDAYEYVTYDRTPPATLLITLEKDGHTYKGTVRLVHLEIEGSKFTGFYSGTLYLQ